MCFLIRFTTNLHEKPLCLRIINDAKNNRITIHHQSEKMYNSLKYLFYSGKISCQNPTGFFSITRGKWFLNEEIRSYFPGTS